MTNRSVGEALELMVPPFDGAGDWQSVLDRSHESRPRLRPRTLVLAVVLAIVVAVIATPAFGVQRLLLDLIGRTNVSFSHSKPAPNEVKKSFLDLEMGAPPPFAPEAIAGQARTVGTFVANGRRRQLWVVPTRRGGYCWQLELSLGGCRATTADREGSLGVSDGETKEPTTGWYVVSTMLGDITSPRAAKVTVHYADGTTTNLPFVWVSKPIAAGFFAYDVPTSHLVAAHRVTSIVLSDAKGHRLGSQRFTYEKPRPFHPLPMPKQVRHAPPGLPSTPPVAPTAPVQHASADGFTVVAGANEAVQFTQTGVTTATRRLDGHGMGIGCFRLAREFGIFTVRELSYGERLFRSSRPMGFQLHGVGTPFDGCEIQGSAGHLWPDVNGSHSAVEIPFTAAGRRFFADRAAARDLALFVRGRRVHAIRREPAAQARRDLYAAYGQRLRRSAIRIAVDGADLTFSERSSTGELFTVVVRNGRIARKNLEPYAFVF